MGVIRAQSRLAGVKGRFRCWQKQNLPLTRGFPWYAMLLTDPEQQQSLVIPLRTVLPHLSHNHFPNLR